MSVVAATPTEDGGPFTVHRADGTKPPRRVHRKELQLCPVGLSPPQDDPESPAEQCAHKDSSSTDTGCELLFLLNPRRTSAVPQQRPVPRPVLF